jgi:hypothetical protein
MIDARIVLTTESMKDGTTAETGGVTTVENVNVMVLVCKMLLLDSLGLNIVLERVIKDDDAKPLIGNGLDGPREPADMQVDNKPVDDYEPTEEDIATMMGFGGFSTTKVQLPFFLSSAQSTEL